MICGQVSFGFFEYIINTLSILRMGMDLRQDMRLIWIWRISDKLSFWMNFKNVRILVKPHKLYNHKKNSSISWGVCGPWGIRTPDPLGVNQMLWTNWAKSPLPVCEISRFWCCKYTSFFYFCKFFSRNSPTTKLLPPIKIISPFLRFCFAERYASLTWSKIL